MEQTISFRDKILGRLMRKPDGQTIFLAMVLGGGLLVVLYMVWFYPKTPSATAVAKNRNLTLNDIPFNGQRAYEYLKAICALGSRVSGSQGMAAQQKMLEEHFSKLGGKVGFQKFRRRHPETGKAVELANLIVQWHPNRNKRILLCAHYDTRPFPDRDPRNPRGLFIGANDGASGVALLSEMAQEMPKFESPFGIDFVLFDGEEFVYNDRRDRYFLGSEYFSHDYVRNPPPYKYHAGVLLDMVGDAHLEIYQERFSMSWRDTRPMVVDIWNVAKSLGVKEFIPRRGYEIRDDHLALHNIAKIPTCDIIDFDYPRRGFSRSYWHTTADTPDKCSALSLAKVGWVVHEWLKRVK